jgi:hypothetical protein
VNAIATPPEDAAKLTDDAGLPDGAAFDAMRMPEAAGTCSPGDVSSFTSMWTPPVGPHTGACHEDELTQLVMDCFDPTAATATACSAWFADGGNTACAKCVAGPVTATTWTPLIYSSNPGESDYINVPGCVALADPFHAPCAHAIEAQFSCELAACEANCPVPQAAGALHDAAIKNLGDCFAAADVGGCNMLANEALACASPLLDGGASSFCFSADSDAVSLGRFLDLACGPGPMDGGGGGG